MIRGEKLKLFGVIFILIITLLQITLAEEDVEPSTFDEQKAYDWLYGKITTNQTQVHQVSLAIIALNNKGGYEINPIVRTLIDSKHTTEACWPKNNCNNKDTALAALALQQTGQVTEARQAIEWIKNNLKSGVSSGEWIITLNSDINGTCTITPEGKTPIEYELRGDKLQGRGVVEGYYISINNIAPELIRTKTDGTIHVDCTSLPQVTITLAYKPNRETFYILESKSATNLDLKINNGCLPATKTGNCDYESTLYSAWVMSEIGVSLEEFNTLLYLEKELRTGNDLHLAILTRTLNKLASLTPINPGYFNEALLKRQNEAGSWGNNVIDSSFAIFALSLTDKDTTQGVAYLERVNGRDGSWNNDLKNTAIALIALHGPNLASGSFGGGSGGGDLPPLPLGEICNNGIDDDSDTLLDCADLLECSDNEFCFSQNKCFNEIQYIGEEGTDCGEICNKECPQSSECNTDFDCNPDQECRSSSCIEKSRTNVCTSNNDCTSTQECLEGICATKSTNPPEKSNVGKIILILVIFLIILGLALFYWKYLRTGKINIRDLFKRKPKGQSFEEFKRAPHNPRTQTNPQQRIEPQREIPRKQIPIRKSKEDMELENSLREAERILKGK